MLRKALALALALLCQLTLLAPQSCAAYTDVPQNAWYHDMVNQMSQTGLLSGYQDGSFRPDNPITAAEFTAVTARAAIGRRELCKPLWKKAGMIGTSCPLPANNTTNPFPGSWRRKSP